MLIRFTLLFFTISVDYQYYAGGTFTFPLCPKTFFMLSVMGTIAAQLINPKFSGLNHQEYSGNLQVYI